MKIAFYALRDFDELKYCEQYKARYGIDYVWTSEYPSEKNLSLAEGCEAVSVTPCRIPESFADQWHAMGVRHYLCRSIGYDHLPKAHIQSLGGDITISTYPPECVSDYTIMLMLMALRRMNSIMLRALAQDYSLKGKIGKELRNCTVGIIGTGSIGASVIEQLEGFRCPILAYSAHPKEELKNRVTYVGLDTLYRECDIISLHTASTPDTYHLINEEALAKMKDGVILINTARGNLIDSKALISAIQSGKVGGAGLDLLEDENGLYYHNRTGEVLQNEELAMLRSFPNVIVSPHTAFYTETTVDNMLYKPFYAMHCYANGLENPYEVK